MLTDRDGKLTVSDSDNCLIDGDSRLIDGDDRLTDSDDRLTDDDNRLTDSDDRLIDSDSLLTSRFTRADLRGMDLPVRGYHPFPTCTERAGWRVRPAVYDSWIKGAEAYLDYDWPAVTADMYLAVKKTGQLMPHWNRFRERRSGLGILAFAECMENKGRFITQIINGIVATCEETVWINPLGMSRHGFTLPGSEHHEVDLTTSETASLLLWIDYLLGDQLDAVSVGLRQRMRECIKTRFITPYMAREDYWWMGFVADRANNWNPWCNMNAIMCALFIEDDPDRRADMLYKIMRSLDSYVAAYPADGCCDEGPMYWGAAGGGLFVCLELLEQASGGAIRVYDHEKLRRIGQYIKKVHIDGPWFVNYADGDARVPVDGVVYRFGKAIGDTGMMGLGAERVKTRQAEDTASTQPKVYEWFRAYQLLQEIFTESERQGCTYAPEYPTDAWFAHTGVMVAREHAGSAKGFFLSAKAGTNIESHNHNDIGNFIVYYNGRPLIVDIGTEEYTAKTFGPQRYEIWYIQSRYHNCPEVNGIGQHAGSAYRATAVCYVGKDVEAGGGGRDGVRDGDGDNKNTFSHLEMELAQAYPAEAGIISWRRAVGLTRGPVAAVTIRDRFTLREASEDIAYYLITPCKPVVTDSAVVSVAPSTPVAPAASEVPGTETKGSMVTMNCGGQQIAMHIQGDVTVRVEDIDVTESRLRDNWGDRLYRVVIKENGARLSGEGLITLTASDAV